MGNSVQVLWRKNTEIEKMSCLYKPVAQLLHVMSTQIA